jgi:hypothetical protein
VLCLGLEKLTAVKRAAGRPKDFVAHDCDFAESTPRVVSMKSGLVDADLALVGHSWHTHIAM